MLILEILLNWLKGSRMMSPTLTSTSCDLDLWPFDPHNCSLFCNHFCQYCVDKFANGQTSRVDTVMSPGSLTWQMRNNVWYQLQHRQLTKRTTKKSREIAWRIQENDLMTENLLHEAIWCLLKVCDGKMVWWSYAWSYGGCFLQINKCFCNTSCTDVVDLAVTLVHCWGNVISCSVQFIETVKCHVLLLLQTWYWLLLLNHIQWLALQKI